MSTTRIKLGIHIHLFVRFICVLLCSHVLSSAHEARLLHDLFNKRGYNKDVRPVAKNSDALSVNFGMTMISFDLDEANEELTTAAWMRYKWNDMFLSWDPAEYGGIDYLRIPINKIWSPDIVLFNHVDAGSAKSYSNEYLAVINSSGDIIHIPQTTLKTTCSIDATSFPYDLQRCVIKFGSWTYDGFKMDVNFFDGKEDVALDSYVPSNEWDLVETSGDKNVKYYPCCSEPFIDITFSVTIARTSGMMSYAFIFPTVILSILTLLTFLFPAVSDVRKIYILLVSVASFFQLDNVTRVLPAASHSIPLLVSYIAVLIILNVLSILLSFLVGCVQSIGKSGFAMPGVLQMVVRPISRLCSNKNGQSRQKEDQSNVENEMENKMLTEKVGNEDKSIEKVASLFNDVLARVDEARERLDNAQDWKILANMLDAVFFVVYLIIICAFAGVLLG